MNSITSLRYLLRSINGFSHLLICGDFSYSGIDGVLFLLYLLVHLLCKLLLTLLYVNILQNLLTIARVKYHTCVYK